MRVKRFFTAIVATLALMPLQMFAQDAENEAELLKEKQELILQTVVGVDEGTFSNNVRVMMNADGTGVVTMLNFYSMSDNEQEKEVFENALKDIAVYVGSRGRVKDRMVMKTVLINYIDSHDDVAVNSFAISLFQYFVGKADVEDLSKYTQDERYADAMIRILADEPSFASYIDKNLKKNNGDLNPKGAYAYAIGKLGMKDKEDVLVSWLKKADVPAKIDIYNALLVVGSEKSKLIVEKGAKKLCRKKNSEVKIAGMRILVKVQGQEAMPYLYKALKNNNKDVRREALTLMMPYSDDAVRAFVVKKYAKKEALPDVVEWLGNLADKSQLQFVEAQLSSEDPKTVEAAIRAIAKIKDANAMKMLMPYFAGEYKSVVKEIMLDSDAGIVPLLIDVLRGNDEQKLTVLEIVGEKRFKIMYNRVYEQLNNANPEIRDVAYKTLKNVAGINNSESLTNLLESCDEKRVADVQNAIVAAYANAKAEQKDNFKSMLKNVRDDIRPRFDKVLESMGLNWD